MIKQMLCKLINILNIHDEHKEKKIFQSTNKLDIYKFELENLPVGPLQYMYIFLESKCNAL